MSKGEGFGDVPDPFGQIDSVDTTYQPPRNLAGWQPGQPSRGNESTFPPPPSFSVPASGPNPSSPPPPIVVTERAPSGPLLEDDEPFTAAHLSGSRRNGAGSTAELESAPLLDMKSPKSGEAVQAPLPFTTSVPPSGMSGKITGERDQKPSNAGSNLSLGFGGASGTNGRDVPFSMPDTRSELPSAGMEGPGGLPQEDFSSYSMFNIKRYREYFNVDTEDVLLRLYRSVIFFFRGDFLEQTGGNPDLWGPFWIASTLVFVSAAAGNTASYISYRHHRGEDGSDPPSSETGGGPAAWYYDVDKVGGSMGLFYGYVGVLGLVIWGVLKWFQAGFTLPQVWCVYGYAMASFIPMAALCVIPVEAARWTLVMAATAASATFLLLNFRQPLIESTGSKSMPILLGMVCLHAVLGLSLKLYFFHYSTNP